MASCNTWQRGPCFICSPSLKRMAMFTKPSGHKEQSDDKPPNDIFQVPHVWAQEADPATCSLVVPVQGEMVSSS